MPAARWVIRCPVLVEPTNPIAATRGSPAISSPTSSPGPVTRLNTPAGRAASTMHSASATEHRDVSRAGFQTTVLPAASAGAMSSAGIVYGQFHGVMTPTTPFGTR